MGTNNATWQELNDPWNEWGTAELDFDQDDSGEDSEWWQQQDAELEAQELERIEINAELEELRHNGYWD